MNHSRPTSHTPQRSDPLLAVLVNLAHIQILVLVLLRLGSTLGTGSTLSLAACEAEAC
ncbi:hypothetical protein [Acinetobacter radioresistens]|uniref:hypothetical protein n=1 Tax=Acinetobacter radioresistens TaxID=40216 RepID=UPI00148ED6F1|nr:hypothetical protein [Acinetobacter radioresistens]